MTSAKPPFVSVIVPVRDDGERLVRCLEALLAQSYPRSSYEILVVDNGSREPLAPLVERVAGSRARCLSETRTGSYAARNRALACAQGEILAFTDADCLPAPDWLERGVDALAAHPDCALLAGRIEVFAADPARPTSVEIYESLCAFPQERYLRELHFGATANLFTRAEIVRRVGPFEPSLPSGGDREWGERVFACGLAQRYAPAARVLHPARRHWRALAAKLARTTGGRHAAGRRSGHSGPRILADLLRAAVPPLRTIARILRAPLPPGARARAILVACFAQSVILAETLRLALGGAPRP